MNWKSIKSDRITTTLRYLIRPVPVHLEPLFRRVEKSMERIVAMLVLILYLPTLSITGFSDFGWYAWPAIVLPILPAILLVLVRVPHRFQALYYNSGHIVIAVALLVAGGILNESPQQSGSEFFLFVYLLLLQILRPGRFKAASLTLLVIVLFLLRGLVPLPFVIEDYLLLFYVSACVLLIHTFVHYLILRFVELEQHRLRERNELDLARRVHESLFPAFSGNERIRIFKYHLPENQIGGDFYDLVFLREGNLGIFLTDISGHGISSAMMSTALKVILSRIPYRNRLSPAALLTSLDKTMAESYESHHATGVYIFFDFLKKNVLMANAGHPPVLLARKGEQFAELATTGSLMGMGIREPTADEIRRSMQSGDRYLMYTDGLLEYETTAGTIAFLDDLEVMLRPLHSLDSETLLSVLIDQIKKRPDFQRFRDDVLVLIAEIP